MFVQVAVSQKNLVLSNVTKELSIDNKARALLIISIKTGQ